MMKRNNYSRVDRLRLNQLRAVYLLPFTLAVLSGCTPYSESFDCPPGQGVGCKSLSVINQMVEEGKLPIESVPPESKELSSNQGLIQAQNARVPHSLVQSKIPPAQNTHMKVWLAAYEDQGIIHEPSTVYVAFKSDSAIETTKENSSRAESSQVEQLPMSNH